MAPPAPSWLLLPPLAWLAENVLLVTVTAPPLEMAPPAPKPPLPVAWLPENVLSATVSVPLLKMAPPWAGAPVTLPFSKVRSCRLRVAPEFTTISCTEPSPLIVIPGEVVGPSMVRFPVIAGNVDRSVIVPVTLNSMVLAPLAAFASVIAWRRLPAPLSPVMLTDRFAARANPDITTNINGSAIPPSARRRFRSATDHSPQRNWPRRQFFTRGKPLKQV